MSQPYPPYPTPPPYYDPPRRRFRFPWLRGGFLLLVGGFVVAFLASGDVRARTHTMAVKAASWVEEVQQATEPPKPSAPPGEDYAPTRQAYAGANGANVRSYPLPHATLLADVPARSELNVNGRMDVQGQWWFRVALPDGRIGFVHSNSITWGHAIAAAAARTQTASTTTSPAQTPAPAQTPPSSHVTGIIAFDPSVLAEAGHAGAKIRTSPARNGRVIVRIPRGADVTLIGRRRMSGHWWYYLRLEDGREGYARDDVITLRGGGRLRFSAE